MVGPPGLREMRGTSGLYHKARKFRIGKRDNMPNMVWQISQISRASLFQIISVPSQGEIPRRTEKEQDNSPALADFVA